MSIGLAIDVFSRRTHKSKAHFRLCQIWDRLTKSNIPNFPKAVAQWSVDRVSGLLGNSDLNMLNQKGEKDNKRRLWFNFKTIVAMGIVSCCLTLAAQTLGSRHTPLFGYFGVLVLFFEQWEILSLYLITNLVFDFTTIAVTVHILGVVSRTNQLMKIQKLLLLDFLLAVLLMLVCAVSADLMTGFVSYVLGPAGIIREVITGWIWLFAPNSEYADRGGLFNALYSATTLIPTMIYLSFLSALVVAKPIAEAGRLCVIHLLTAAKDYDPSELPVGTMGMAFLASLTSIVIIVVYVINVVRSL